MRTTGNPISPEPSPSRVGDPEASPLSSLEGVVERLTYANAETRYAVLKLKVKGRREAITVVGPLAGVREGEELHLKGHFEIHPKWGEQFRVVWWYAILPATREGIERYLSSGLVKGIGPELARRLVNHFGAETLRVIEQSPERLKEVPGIGDKRVAQILRDWQEHREAREILVGLQGLGLSLGLANKIYHQYGDQALAVATSNPYRLALEVSGVGFLTADRLASRLNLDPLAPARLAAGLLHVLESFGSEGHVYAPEEELLRETAALLEVSPEALRRPLDHLVREGHLVAEDKPSGRVVYRKAAWVAETGVARDLGRLLLASAPPAPLHLEELLARVQQERHLCLSEEQERAVTLALREKVVIITGGPGTGKTTIVSCILDLFRRLGARVLLVAPTGRAAKRLSETTGAEAATIHRALEFSPQTGGFRRNASDPLKAEVIIVDEMSMVDIYLMYHLLRAVPAGSRLILVGDVHQLPAVGPGNVLKDLIDSGVVPVARLTRIYRQAQESLIVVNAHRVNQGVFPKLPRRLGQSDFVFVELEDPETLKARLLDLVTREIPAIYGFDPLREIQVITPMHRGPLGIQTLNQELQRRLNPQGPQFSFGARTFRQGDKVMQLKNNYLKEVFNGDIGQVTGFVPEGQRLVVEFDGRTVTYEPAEADEIMPAYAVTVHKAQGSEFPAVVLILTTHHYLLLQRHLLYTALTRGRRLVVLLGSTRALALAIKNERPIRRYTDLALRLRQAAPRLSPA